MNKRKSGLLLALSSLPGPYGIGGFGQEALAFIDILHRAEQGYWQILPLGPTGFGNSPYSSFSTQAGNPLYIDLEDLGKKGLLLREELDHAKRPQGRVDYTNLHDERLALLKKAFSRVQRPLEEEIRLYAQNNPWLDDFALFMCLKDLHQGRSWLDWPDEYRNRKPQALEKIREQEKVNYQFWIFTQFVFHKNMKDFN
ncbi:MAG TPA: 4-alpha-glucanotransferase, partial [Clostridia bacterium]|nr:4-alpha-glucanotransferase [Clostridia bacterium]